MEKKEEVKEDENKVRWRRTGGEEGEVEANRRRRRMRWRQRWRKKR